MGRPHDQQRKWTTAAILALALLGVLFLGISAYAIYGVDHDQLDFVTAQPPWRRDVTPLSPLQGATREEDGRPRSSLQVVDDEGEFLPHGSSAQEHENGDILKTLESRGSPAKNASTTPKTGIPPPAAGAAAVGRVFLPGSITADSRIDVMRRCYVDPQKLHLRHFSQELCSISEKYKLVYYLMPKSGSSTGRHVMKHDFDATERGGCKHMDLSAYFRFAILRNPVSRFFASYEEMFVRRLGKLDLIPKKFRAFMKPYEGFEYKQYSAMFDDPAGVTQLTRTFEEFMGLWDGNPFDNHLSLQVPSLADPITGRISGIDMVFDTHKMEESFGEIAKRVGAAEPRIIKGRAYPRRMNVSDISAEAWRQLCRIAAVDFCCLNYPLPAQCLEPTPAVQCRYRSAGRGAADLLVEPVVQ